MWNAWVAARAFCFSALLLFLAGFCKPSEKCWPSAAEWKQLASTLSGKLVHPEAPGPGKHSPFELEDLPGATQSTGWLDAWSAAPSPYAVEAANATDIATAVAFARAHHLKIVVKGTGHDYLGRSTDPDALLVWTHDLRKVTVTDSFVPQGCKVAGVPAVTVEAGTRWLEAYQEVTGKHGRYVQGGGCTSVGAAGGFLQGGGFGSFSKKFGIAAASLVEAEVVTADGKIVIANACEHADLFWALRGGGGGTFGIVTKATLRTHELPKTFGGVFGKIVAKSDKDYAALIEQIVRFYHASLSNEHWGEQLALHRDNTIDVAMLFEGLTTEEAEQVWKPMRAWLDARKDRYTTGLQALAIPAAKLWDFAFLEEHKLPVSGDATRWWWTSNEEELGAYWAAYQSRWIPDDQFGDTHAKQLAAALYAASREWTVGLHFNKGQAGAAKDAIARGRETAVNPQVFDAAALVIISAIGDPKDRAKLEAARGHVTAAMQAIVKVTPGAGAYINETDYFLTDWKRAFWGDQYDKLLAIKHKYDPDRMFSCHHCVGSDE